MGRHALNQLWTSTLRHGHRPDRLPPRRQLVDNRAVEIRVSCHRQGPRNRRRGHDELMRRHGPALTLLFELQPLVNAETVLLVDDHQRELLEAHGLLKERMRTHDDLRMSGS